MAAAFGTRVAFDRTYLVSWCRPCTRDGKRERAAAGYVQPRLDRPPVESGLKHCPCCALDLDVGAFAVNRRNPDGRAFYCKECAKAKEKARRASWSPERRLAESRKKGRDQKRAHLMRTFGITLPVYEAMLAIQGGACAVCGRPEGGVRRGAVISLAVDHDRACCPGTRSCGACVRGLLCSNCNLGLGSFADDPERLVRAAEYVEQCRSVAGHKQHGVRQADPAAPEGPAGLGVLAD